MSYEGKNKVEEYKLTMVCSEIVEALYDEVRKLRSMVGAKDVLWRAVQSLGLRCDRNCGRGLYILVITAPCYGFGDIIFGKKFAEYLRSWYGATVDVATTHKSGFVKIGESPDNLISLLGKSTECRRFARLKPEEDLGVPDLIFVAPLQADFSPSISDVRALIPSATKFNTYFLSEYNPENPREFDFPTGVGDGHMGLFLTSKCGNIRKPEGMSGSYALAYIAQSIDGSEKCMLSFLEMVASKYRKSKVFSIVIPSWVLDDVDDFGPRLMKLVRKYFGRVELVRVDGSVEFEGSGNGVLVLRGDILPVSHDRMMSLMKWSVRDILLTGDQSISDALACCPEKNIFYQIAPWKEGLGRGLAKYLPNKYLRSHKTSCGTLKAVSYKSNYRKFVEHWNFETLGKPKLDAVVMSSVVRVSNPSVNEVIEIVGRSRRLHTMKRSVFEYIDGGC